MENDHQNATAQGIEISADGKTLEKCPEDLVEIVIPGRVTTIGQRAFAHCWALASVEIPDSVRSIGRGAFCGCVKLKSVVIRNGDMEIGREVFYKCPGLKSIKTPNGDFNGGNLDEWTIPLRVKDEPENSVILR